MDNRIFKARLKRIRDAVSQLGANCLIVTKPANVTYLTGFTGSDSWAILLPATLYFITDSRYATQAAEQCRLCRIIKRKDTMVKTIANLLRNKRRIKVSAVEKSTSLADFEKLKKHLSCRLKPTAGIVESVRRTKDKTEIAAVHAAAKIAFISLGETIKQIRQGLTENQTAGILELQIRKFGGAIAFETIVAFGANAAKPHHQPTARKLHANDTVLIDFGVRYHSYCCDITRCFAVGKPTALYNKMYAAVADAQIAALKTIKAGVDITQVDAAARNTIKKSGLPVYEHGTGHGLGLEVHELPPLSNRAKGTLQAGDVITIEPAVYIPGRLGIRIEDDVLVTENGYVVLSRNPRP